MGPRWRRRRRRRVRCCAAKRKAVAETRLVTLRGHVLRPDADVVDADAGVPRDAARGRRTRGQPDEHSERRDDDDDRTMESQDIYVVSEQGPAGTPGPLFPVIDLVTDSEDDDDLGVDDVVEVSVSVSMIASRPGPRCWGHGNRQPPPWTWPPPSYSSRYWPPGGGTREAEEDDAGRGRPPPPSPSYSPPPYVETHGAETTSRTARTASRTRSRSTSGSDCFDEDPLRHAAVWDPEADRDDDDRPEADWHDDRPEADGDVRPECGHDLWENYFPNNEDLWSPSALRSSSWGSSSSASRSADGGDDSDDDDSEGMRPLRLDEDSDQDADGRHQLYLDDSGYLSAW